MAAGVLTGLGANAAFGCWWLDRVLALGIAVIAVGEGRETWRGEGCCAIAPIGGSDPCEDSACEGRRLSVVD